MRCGETIVTVVDCECEQRFVLPLIQLYLYVLTYACVFGRNTRIHFSDLSIHQVGFSPTCTLCPLLRVRAARARVRPDSHPISIPQYCTVPQMSCVHECSMRARQQQLCYIFFLPLPTRCMSLLALDGRNSVRVARRAPVEDAEVGADDPHTRHT